jgi:hypothetical protein
MEQNRPQKVLQAREECQGIGFSRAVKSEKHWASAPGWLLRLKDFTSGAKAGIFLLGRHE